MIEFKNMLDIKFIRENPKIVKDAVLKKNMKVDIDRVLELDKKRRDILKIVENLRAQQNKASYDVSQAKTQKDRNDLIETMRDLKRNLKESEVNLENIESEFEKMLKLVPNIPFDDVPIGPDENSNVVLREINEKPQFSFQPKDYLEIAKFHGWIDIERAAKVSGSRFGYIKGDLALLEFAIIRYALDFLTSKERLREVVLSAKCQIPNTPFTPVLPPVLIKPEYMDAMGFLVGDIAEDIYYLEKDDLYLVGTSEQSIGPMHAGEIFEEEDLPVRYVGFSTCFRREAGSHGKDTKGILRVHQFDKIEMISFSHPEKSRDEHKFLIAINETMMQELGLPYRVLHISTGDMGFAKADMFDVETWIPSEGRYRETHSASNITDFQARRLSIKYKDVKGQHYVHMLNDTAFALGRILIAIIENFQTEDGKVQLPKALQNYMGSKTIPR